MPGIGQSSWIDVMLMIRPPPPCLIICLAAIWVPKNALLRLIAEHLLVLALGGVEHGGAGLHAGVVDHDVEAAERATVPSTSPWMSATADVALDRRLGRRPT